MADSWNKTAGNPNHWSTFDLWFQLKGRHTGVGTPLQHPTRVHDDGRKLFNSFSFRDLLSVKLSWTVIFIPKPKVFFFSGSGKSFAWYRSASFSVHANSNWLTAWLRIKWTDDQERDGWRVYYTVTLNAKYCLLNTAFILQVLFSLDTLLSWGVFFFFQRSFAPWCLSTLLPKRLPTAEHCARERTWTGVANSSAHFGHRCKYVVSQSSSWGFKHIYYNYL